MNTFNSCGKKFQLSYLDKVPQSPQGALIGGRVVHEVIAGAEERDTWATDEGKELLGEMFLDSFHRALEGIEDEVRWGGRKTRDYPNGEDKTWWEWFGPVALRRYADIRRADEPAGLTLKKGGTELKVSAFLEDGMEVTGYIDAFLLVDADGRYMTRDWKGLALETPLATPTGWTTMGAVRLGDEVFGGDGRPCRVIGKSETHYKPCRRVVFDDGQELIADWDHQWQTESMPGLKTKVLTTDEIAATIGYSKQGKRHHRIYNALPLDLPALMLPVDPYVLGVWLGDGNRGRGVITNHDEDVWAEIRNRGYRLGELDSGHSRGVFGLVKGLRRLGLLGNKHIPQSYLRASEEQRVDLLRGLMDSDGSWNRARDQANISMTDKGLSLSIFELVMSLGERANFWTGIARGFGLEVTQYRTTWSPTIHNPFIMRRKADQVRFSESVKSKRRLIVSIEPTITVPTACISVDSPDHLYLAGEAMIPTHNTGRPGNNDPIQLATYAWMCREAGIGHVSVGQYAYLKATSQDKALATFELDDLVPLVPTLYGDLAKGIQAGIFTIKPSNFCKSCSVKAHCEYGATL